MRKIIFLATVILAATTALAQSAITGLVHLTPYVENDANTPKADKILLDKLNRIVTDYGAESKLSSPFIITAHAITLDMETTATAPPQTIANISLTIYIGNGQEGIKFSSCNLELKGSGKNLDAVYSSAFRKINPNDPKIQKTLAEGEERIKKYYEEAGPKLLQDAKIQATAGNYEGAYDILLRIPPVCPQYKASQDLLISYIQQESDSKNSELISKARAAWSSSPDESGAPEANRYLSQMSNISEKMRLQALELTKTMATRLEKVSDDIRSAEQKYQANVHSEKMALIKGATEAAVARAKNRPVYHYHVHGWW